MRSIEKGVSIFGSKRLMFKVDFYISPFHLGQDLTILNLILSLHADGDALLVFLECTSSHSCTAHLFFFEWSVPFLTHVH